MKKICLIFALAIGVHFTIFSQGNQPCLPQGIDFKTQGQVDSFSINYPGCNFIEGDVLINSFDILLLDGLGIMKGIGGNLKVLGNYQLQRLLGLNGVDSIFGDFFIGSNPVLGTIEALDSLWYIGGDLLIAENNALESLEGLDSLAFVAG
jgi:hypothetical protein